MTRWLVAGALVAAGVIAAGGSMVLLEPTPLPVRASAVHLRPVVIPRSGPVTFAVVGDSITAWEKPYFDDPARTWVTTANDAELVLVGGWAVGGKNTAEIRAGVGPVAAEVLVIMAGTNDVYQGVPMLERLSNLRAIAATVGAEHVVVSSTAPYDIDVNAGLVWNAVLENLAATEGWAFIDPWSAVRTIDGHYVAGATTDGVHPTPATASVVGASIHGAVVSLYR